MIEKFAKKDPVQPSGGKDAGSSSNVHRFDKRGTRSSEKYAPEIAGESPADYVRRVLGLGDKPKKNTDSNTLSDEHQEGSQQDINPRRGESAADYLRRMEQIRSSQRPG